MKRLISALIFLSVLLLTGCKKDDLEPVSIGNLSFHYDTDLWGFSRAGEDAPMEFKDSKGNLLTITASQESTYQHPIEMIRFVELMLTANDSFQVFLEPKEIKVNDTTWYEYGYTLKEGNTVHKFYQRYYGKNYVAASLSYSSTEENYDSGYKEAKRIMDDMTVKEEKNEANETEEREFLVGEWDVQNSGYLVLNEDSTYEWYKDSSKDKNNMHHGTYAGDVENTNMTMNKGDGIYLVLFPEALIIDGVTEIPGSHKVDYIISLDMNGSDGYSMVNMSSYNLYTLIKK